MPVLAEKLNRAQEDALQELCNIGMGHATTDLAQLMGKTIYFDIPRISQVPISQIPQIVGNAEQTVVGIYLRFSGPISGNIILIFPKKSVLLLRQIMTGDKSRKLVFDEYNTSLLKEVGNILTGSYLSVMENLLKMQLVQSVPWFAFDLASAIIDPILIQLGKDTDNAVVIEAEFFVRESENLKGRFYLLPDPKSVKLMLEAVGMGG
jgi:chemotaxis protein CheC